MRHLLDGAPVIELNPLLEFELRRLGLGKEAALQTIKASGTVCYANALRSTFDTSFRPLWRSRPSLT